MAARAKSAALPWAAFRLGPPLCIGRAAGGFFYAGWAMHRPPVSAALAEPVQRWRNDHKSWGGE